MIRESDPDRTIVASSRPLLRRVTAFTAGCVIVSNMIGTGIFGTTGFMARDLGHPVIILLLWALGGGLALLGALCYCELGTAMPRAGGEYVYIREAYGPLLGFLSGWMSLTIGFSAAIASNGHLFAIHLQQLFPALTDLNGTGTGWQHYLFHPKTIALVMVWALTMVHVAGVGAGGLVQRMLTVVKVGAIVLLVTAAVLFGQGHVGRLITSPAEPSVTFSAVVVSLLFVTFSYAGWNAAGYIAGEMIRPQQNILRATMWATICVTVLYLALNAVYLYALPITELAADPVELVAHKSAAAMFGPTASRWVTAMLCVSILGAASAMIWAGPRVYYAMARDGLFPAVFAGTTASAVVPARAILLQSVWVSVLVLSGTFEALILYAGFVILVFTALAVGAVPLLRIRRPQKQGAYRIRYHPLIPALYLIASLGVMLPILMIRPIESLLGIATVLIGVPFYLFWKRNL